MAPTVRLSSSIPDDTALVAVPIFEGRVLPSRSTVDVDVTALAAVGFEGKAGESATMVGNGGPGLIAVGLGQAKDVTVDSLRLAAAKAVKAAWRASSLTLTLLDAAPAAEPERAAQAVAEGALLASYRFTAHKSDPKPCQLDRVDIVGRGARLATAVERAATIVGAVSLARDLGNEPPGVVTPARLGEVASQIASSSSGLTCTVLDEAGIERERLGGLRGVSAGSAQPPRLVRMVWEPARSKGTIALVGKGITFDSGGLSLKTAQGMMTMKDDMSGAAAVIAVMSVLPALKPPFKVIGYAPATENLPGPFAIKPGDVLTIRNGKTVEVLNTDAEGRLVLADALSLAVEDGVDAIVDMATLTGACVTALGTKIAGLMGNDETWVGEVQQAATRAGEAVWHLPLPPEYRSHIDSQVADIKNIGDSSGGGALSAGLFLKEFVGDVPWVHLDIAGPAWTESDDGFNARGSTGMVVRTIIELLTAGSVPRRRSRASATAATNGVAKTVAKGRQRSSVTRKAGARATKAGARASG